MPAPPGESFSLGPVDVQWYGLCVLLGFLVWVLVTARMWKRGGGDAIDAGWACLLAAPVAFIGARVYHVVTDYDMYRGNPTDAFDVTQGGLGIFGAILGGVLAIVIYANARSWPVGTFLDCAIVGVPLAQAIGRFGNYFNQELIGSPTSLPWALFVDPPFRPLEYANVAYFHPVFLYEAVLNVMIFLLLGLLWKPLHERFRPGCMVGAYLMLYGLARLLVEGLRIEPALIVGPFRLNQVIAFLVIATGAWILLLLDRKRPTGQQRT